MKNIARLLVACAALAFLGGCKTSTEDNLVDHISLVNNQVTFSYDTTFSSSIEADLEGTFYIGDYGTITFFTDSNNLFNIDFQASVDVFSSAGLTQAMALPNGTGFPSIVTGSLYQLPVATGSNYRVIAYLDAAGIFGSGKKLAGVALELGGISNNFPQVSITQNFYNDSNKQIASFTVYGPRTVNGVTLPGGLFLVGDLNAVTTASATHGKVTTKVHPGPAMIYGRDAAKYKTDAEQQQLFDISQKALAKHGFRLHFTKP